ncbi:hypothetical protein V5O48_011965 [Marasmius crinis-equi]|uniref:Ribosome biogenesis protein NOP53 n=1 Tax=Marasmius crinis-equi TaxID=585013 RepID=A0ABR3F4K7_9AGAR
MAKEKAAKPTSASKPKNAKSAIGAPSQRSQSSRKGKRAWRKNVDLDEVEEGLEEIRSEERVHGYASMSSLSLRGSLTRTFRSALHKLADNELFYVDTEADEKIRNSLPRFSTSQLTSAKILAQRSAVPAVYSRNNSTNSASKRKAVSQADKERLLRQAKKPRKGPLNSIVDEADDKWGGAKAAGGIPIVLLDLRVLTERNPGVSEAVKQSGQYDPWATIEEPQAVDEDDNFGAEEIKNFKKPAPKPPKHPSSSSSLPDPRKAIQLSAVPTPHAGMSYNPPVAAHQELLLQAHSAEEKKEKEAEKTREVKERMQKAKELEEIGVNNPRPGMTIDEPGDEEEEEEETPTGEVITKKMPERKTKAQRKKEARRLEEKRILAQRAAKKKMLSFISGVSAKKIRNTKTPTGEEVAARRRKLLEAKLKGGMSGRRLGKYKVPKEQIDVQLGEELSENLRGLKVEGNLFRDRFLNLQQRALIEPRVPVLPKKRRNKVIEYEKHAWKRFDKVQEKL